MRTLTCAGTRVFAFRHRVQQGVFDFQLAVLTLRCGFRRILESSEFTSGVEQVAMEPGRTGHASPREEVPRETRLSLVVDLDAFGPDQEDSRCCASGKDSECVCHVIFLGRPRWMRDDSY